MKAPWGLLACCIPCMAQGTQAELCRYLHWFPGMKLAPLTCVRPRSTTPGAPATKRMKLAPLGVGYTRSCVAYQQAVVGTVILGIISVLFVERTAKWNQTFLAHDFSFKVRFSNSCVLNCFGLELFTFKVGFHKITCLKRDSVWNSLLYFQKVRFSNSCVCWTASV